jgi:hypothetical protein
MNKMKTVVETVLFIAASWGSVTGRQTSIDWRLLKDWQDLPAK